LWFLTVGVAVYGWYCWYKGKHCFKGTGTGCHRDRLASPCPCLQSLRHAPTAPAPAPAAPIIVQIYNDNGGGSGSSSGSDEEKKKKKKKDKSAELSEMDSAR